MKRILVISDIHGEIEKFEQLLEEAQYDAKQDQLILLGDYEIVVKCACCN